MSNQNKKKQWFKRTSFAFLLLGIVALIYYFRFVESGSYYRATYFSSNLNSYFNFVREFPNGVRKAKVDSLISNKQKTILDSIKYQCDLEFHVGQRFSYELFKYCFDKKPDSLYLITTVALSKLTLQNIDGISKMETLPRLWTEKDEYLDYLNKCADITYQVAKLLRVGVRRIDLAVNNESFVKEIDSVLIKSYGEIYPIIVMHNRFSSDDNYHWWGSTNYDIRGKQMQANFRLSLPDSVTNNNYFRVSLSGPIIGAPNKPQWKGSKSPSQVLFDYATIPNIYLYQKVLSWNSSVKFMISDNLLTKGEVLSVDVSQEIETKYFVEQWKNRNVFDFGNYWHKRFFEDKLRPYWLNFNGIDDTLFAQCAYEKCNIQIDPADVENNSEEYKTKLNEIINNCINEVR